MLIEVRYSVTQWLLDLNLITKLNRLYVSGPYTPLDVSYYFFSFVHVCFSCSCLFWSFMQTDSTQSLFHVIYWCAYPLFVSDLSTKCILFVFILMLFTLIAFDLIYNFLPFLLNMYCFPAVYICLILFLISFLYLYRSIFLSWNLYTMIVVLLACSSLIFV